MEEKEKRGNGNKGQLNSFLDLEKKEGTLKKEKKGKMSKSKKELEQKKELSESMDNLDPIENTNKSKDENRNDRAKNTTSWSDSNGDIYIVSFDIENQIFESEIKNDHSFLSQLESSFYRNFGYLNKGSKSDDSYYDRSTDDTQYSWNNYINSYIESFLCLLYTSPSPRD